MRRTGPRVLAIGDAILDMVTPPIPPFRVGDRQIEVPRFHLLPGGNATNFALAAASLGARAVLVASVGSDPFGSVLRAAYRDRGVDARLRTDPARPTGTTVAITWRGGSRALVTSLGANASLRPSDVPGSLLDAADHVHRAGFWWTPGLQGQATARLLARARRAGARTSLDVSTDPRGWRASRVRLVRSCLPHVDVFFGNDVEVCALARRRDPTDAALALCRLGAREVVVHRGRRGAAWVSDGRRVAAPAFAVPAANPTGSGDVFNAAFVVARARGDDPRAALRFSNAVAALHVRDWGRPYPSAREVASFLRTRR